MTKHTPVAGEDTEDPVAREHHVTVSRAARYVVLGEPSPAIRSVWVALHGYGQLAPRFARQCRALARADRLVVVPEALSRFYVEPAAGGSHARARVGASWMTREERLAEISDYVAYLDAVRQRVVEELDGEPRVHVLGFSQGAATAVRWALFGASRPASLTLWGGLVPEDADPHALRESLAGAPLVLVGGTSDELRPVERMAAQLGALRDAGVDARLVEYDGGHRLHAGTLAALADAVE